MSLNLEAGEGTAQPWHCKAQFMADELRQDRKSFSSLVINPRNSAAFVVTADSEWELKLHQNDTKLSVHLVPDTFCTYYPQFTPAFT